MKRLNNLTLLAPLAIASLLSAQALDDLTPHSVKLESVNYLGKRAIKVVEDGDVPSAIVKGTAFTMATSNSNWRGGRQWERLPPHGALLVSLFGCKTSSLNTTSCVRLTDAPRIRSGVIILHSTAHTRTFHMQ